MTYEACDCFDSLDCLNETCHGCDVASDGNASWNAIWCHGQGGEACERSLDFSGSNEARIWCECKLTEEVKGDTTAYDA